eukprot:IDg14358t1
MERLTVFSTIANLLLIAAASMKTGRMFTDHPMEKSMRKRVQMRSYHYASQSEESMYRGKFAYFPRHNSTPGF